MQDVINPDCLIDQVLTISHLWITLFAIDLVRYLLGAGAVVFVLFFLFKDFSEKHRIQVIKAANKDIVREIGFSLLSIAVYATFALYTVNLIESGKTQIYSTTQEYGVLYTVATLPILLILQDTYFYWIHRAIHHPLLFRRIHWIHHLSKTPTPWAAYSFHPIEAFLMTIFVPIILVLIPLHPHILFAFLAIMILRNAMGHSGVEFHPKWWVDSKLDILTSVTHHDLHHQKFHGNYGLYFTWWDRWAGTELPGYKKDFLNAATGNKRTAEKA